MGTIDPSSLPTITAKPANAAYTAGHVVAGLPIPKTKRLELFGYDDWEQFIEEWASSLKDKYTAVRRFSGAGDMGVDVAGFLTNGWFSGGWENYQCKHYDHAVQPSDVWLEFGKVIYYSYLGKFPVPRRYFFAAPHGVGTSLATLLGNPDKLKVKVSANWSKYCQGGITSKADIPLDGDLLSYFEEFDFGIFDVLTPVSLIQQHANTPFHAVRFGGGLPARSASPALPPSAVQPSESRYIAQLFEAYADHLGQVVSPANLSAHPAFEKDFLRQRERFYSAEALRNFARDNVPAGTFEGLQQEAYHGVVDVCEAAHACGFTRMKEVLNQAVLLPFASNPLVSALQTLDKQGICHQLANDDHLVWVPRK